MSERDRYGERIIMLRNGETFTGEFDRDDAVYGKWHIIRLLGSQGATADAGDNYGTVYTVVVERTWSGS